ncbi:Zn-dependent protease [Bacillus sp. SORGH_AS 510]|uniref:site-2 protease family protein n=1 Tax=Bacillus sp. SORGH_AS_0510 TaxID=3041771 RepID=UPI00277D6859|nr:site-2 protease family protein [Bacillus sp. SORGH_AS_0510]MDQ1143662.1 Zn-dependent protease [Bacillus sp. SORGH_AS_0510]
MEKKLEKGGTKTTWGVLGTIAALLLGKLKYLLVILKILKLQTLISMFIYLGTYALIFGWKFAVALVYLLFVHEMGHLYAAKRIKLPVSPAIFIPFMGAVIGMKEMPKNAKDEGFVAYMGPLFGLLSFLPAIPLYLFTHEPFWALLIILGGMLNLFNLIPITPLDGGRIAAGISTKLWGLGIVLLLAYSIMNPSFIGLFIVVIGSIEWYKLFKKQKNLHTDQAEIEELEYVVEKLKQGSLPLEGMQGIVTKAKWKIKNMQIIEALQAIIMEIEKRKKELYLQQLTGTYSFSEEGQPDHHDGMEDLIRNLEEKLAVYKKEVHTTATYYKTDKKTKVQLFLIYMGLVIALALSYYYGNEILMNHPEVQRMMNR